MRTPRLQRDRQQWVYDYIVKETGRVFHWDEESRQLPKSVKSHGQIAKHVGRIAVDQRYVVVAAEYRDDLVGLVLAQQPGIDKHALQLIADGLMDQHGCHR